MRVWGGYISELFSLKLSYIQIYFFRIQYSPSDFQTLWIKLMVRSSWKKNSQQSISQEELCVLCCCRIKQLKQIQDDQFKKIYYCWSIFSSPSKPKDLCEFLFWNPLARPPPSMQAQCLSLPSLSGSHENRITRKEHFQVVGDLQSSHYDCAFSLGIPWHTKGRVSVLEHFLPAKGRTFSLC